MLVQKVKRALGFEKKQKIKKIKNSGLGLILLPSSVMDLGLIKRPVNKRGHINLITRE